MSNFVAVSIPVASSYSYKLKEYSLLHVCSRGVSWKANIRYHVLPCNATMGLLIQRSTLVQDYDRGKINSEAK